MAEVKWIKIVTDIFDDEKVLLIESMPESDAIIVIWFKLLCLAGKQNNGGIFVMSNTVPYTEEMLSIIFRRKPAIVSLALKTFEKFGMIEIINNTITIPNWDKHQNESKLEEIRKYNRLAKQRERQRKQKLLGNGKSQGNVNDSHDTDVDVDKDVDKDNNNNDNETPEHFYSNNIAPITEFVADDIKNLIDDGFEESLILRMMQEAVKNEKRNWKYISAALNNNGNKGIKTLKQYEAHEAERQRSKGGQKVGCNRKYNTENDGQAVSGIGITL